MTKSTFDEEKTTGNYETELLDKPESKELPVLKSDMQMPLQTKENTSENGIGASIVNLLKRTSRKRYDSISTIINIIALFVTVIYLTSKSFQALIPYWTMFAVTMAIFAIAYIISIIGRRLSKEDEPK